MAFCTSCGATVQGAFCPQCGTAVSSSSSQTAPPQPAYAQPAAPAPVPGKRRTSPWVWILVGVLGLFLLCVVSLIGFGIFVARNPGMVMGKLITAANPNAEVVSTDMGSKTMRIRDKRTGQEVTVSFDDVKNGRIRFSATGDDGQEATVEIGGGAGQMPKWVPAYPGAKAQGNMTAKGQGADGAGEGGMVSFTTTDPASKVIDFYSTKCKEMGMNVDMSAVTNDGGTLVATDESGDRAIHVMVGGSRDNTTIALTFGRKR
jgi:hypothetical protein